METFVITCNPFLTADERFAFSYYIEDNFGFWPALALRIKTSNI